MRRAFLLMLLLLTMTSCDDDKRYGPAFRGEVGDEAVSLGDPERYRVPGVYAELLQSHGLLLRSDGRTLAAFPAVCTLEPVALRYDAVTDRIVCPVHDCRWDRDGLVRPGSHATLALPRLNMTYREGKGEKPGELVVMPSRQYRYERNQWSASRSVYEFPKRVGR